eukprot:TRINITY_DN11200_c0_g1_i1.p1 TRINITY_DN11200_c0_g1~~TRINITY_DN11200_c0_g1_i1.p1  ORF type:complete len:1202 (+),score=294.60 TRINITY_DN11200_c0_g1_i1:67-3672(+)
MWSARRLAAAALAAGYAYAQDVRDDSPGIIHETDKIAFLAVLGGLTILAVVGIAVRAFMRGVTLPVLLATVMWVALMTTCCVVWSLTFTSSRDIIVSNKEEELVELMAQTAHKVAGTLESGRVLVATMAMLVQQGSYNISGEFPKAHSDLYTYYNILSRGPGEVNAAEMLYYGRPDERAFGLEVVDPRGDGGDVLPWVRLFDAVTAPSDPIPSWLDCNASNFLSRAECDALLSQCQTADFSASAATASCLAACEVPAGPAACYGPAWPAGGNISAPPALARALQYDARLNTSSGEYLVPVDPPETMVRSGSGRILYNDHLPYFTTRRPWYHKEQHAIWSPPYVYHNQATIGITVSQGVYDVAGSFVACLALDFSLVTLSSFFATVRTTDHTEVLLLDGGGVLLGSTLSEAEARTLGGAGGDGYTSLPNVANAPSGPLAHVQRTLLARFGGVNGAIDAGVALLHDGGRVVVSHPVYVHPASRVWWLLVATLPYSDIMGEAEDASFLALILAAAVAVFCALVVFLAVYAALRPVLGLKEDMAAVALMDLEVEASGADSKIIEVRAMYDSFTCMVANLKEWRQYIPDSCFSFNMDDDADIVTIDGEYGLSGELSYGGFQQNPPLHPHALASQQRGMSSPSVQPSYSTLSSKSWRTQPEHLASAHSAVLGGDNLMAPDATSAGGLKRQDSMDCGGSNHSGGGSEGGGRYGSTRMRRGLTRAVMMVTQAGLKTRNVTLSVVNMKEFLPHCRHMANDDVLDFHSQYLQPVVSFAKNTTGCVDEVSGDHVAISHNAVSRNARHCDAAIGMSLHVTTYFLQQKPYLPMGASPAAAPAGAPPVTPPPAEGFSQQERHVRINVGLSSGQAKVGNMGIGGAKRFTIVGECAAAVRGVERLGAALDVPILACEMTCRELFALYSFANICRAYIPRANRRPFMCLEVIEQVAPPATNNEQEWMYVMEKAIQDSPYREYNAAVMAACDGDYAKADTHIANVNEDLVGVSRCSTFREHMQHFRPAPFLAVALQPVFQLPTQRASASPGPKTQQVPDLPSPVAPERMVALEKELSRMRSKLSDTERKLQTSSSSYVLPMLPSYNSQQSLRSTNSLRQDSETFRPQVSMMSAMTEESENDVRGMTPAQIAAANKSKRGRTPGRKRQRISKNSKGEDTALSPASVCLTDGEDSEAGTPIRSPVPSPALPVPLTSPHVKM